jgi:hypothetical protein
MDSRDQERFSRQIRFSELGAAGQELILRAIDVWSGPLRQIGQPERRPDCPCCGRQMP